MFDLNAQPADGKLDALKAFLAAKRDSGEVVYTYEFLPVLPMMKGPAPISAHRVRWQPDSFYSIQVREAGSVMLPATNDVVTIGGKAGALPWDFSHYTLNVYDKELSPASSALLKNQQYSFLSQLYSVIGFGIMHVPGTLKWKGDVFSAAPYSAEVPLSGEVVCGTNGIPNLIIKRFNGNISHINLLYDGKPRGDNLPTGFELAFRNPKGEMEVQMRMQILMLSVTNPVVDISEFTPWAVLSSLGKVSPEKDTNMSRAMLTMVHSNNANYFVRSNRMVLMKAANPKPASNALFLFAMLSSLPLFLIMYHLYRKNNKPKKM
ncbi:MAG: hypothetical protein ACO1QS_14545 [Verrucomicrobiota bacterium]